MCVRGSVCAGAGVRVGGCGVIAQLVREPSYGGITSGTLQGCKFQSL